MDELKKEPTSIIWPIIILTGVLFVYAVKQYMFMERATIMGNWAQMRCDVFVLFASYWLKPETDLRSDGEFAAENFKFCTKDIVQNVMKVVMAPFMTAFGKQADVTKVFTVVLNSIKTVIKKMQDKFMSFMDPFFVRFNAVVHQIGIVTQKLRMAFQRVNATLLTAVFSGLSIVKGINNAINFVIKIVMIIIAIMLALIIILFFILFPFIPIIIIPVLTAIIGIGVAASAEASDAKGGFCFAPDTLVQLADGSSAPISTLVLGQALANGAIVEGILMLEGHRTPLFSLEGIRVSGSHLVLGSDWHSVEQDPRASSIADRLDRLYCLNTSTQRIPVLNNQGSIILFRDWEEIDSRDTIGQAGWNRLVSSLLGGIQPSAQTDTFCLMDPRIEIPCAQGNKLLESIQIGDEIVLTYNNHTRVIGIVEGYVEGVYETHWLSSCIEKTYNPTVYRRITTLRQNGTTELLKGRHLITDSGMLVVHANRSVLQLRDFTEVGIDQIHRTYPFVQGRLAILS